MKQTKIMHYILKFLYVAVISLLFSCGENTLLETNKPTLNDFTVGEKWTWKWQRSVEGEVLGEGVDVKEVVNYKGDLGFHYVHLKDTVKITEIVNRKQSKNPFRDWPLKLGKKWKHIENWENESGEKGRYNRDVEVVSFEKITVKAGEFWAYKIKYDGVIENFATGGKGEMVDFWWYCPDLKDYLKHTQDSGNGFLYSSELIKYSNPNKN
ncbi:hypothetical protein [Pontimicrobium aquaticum]|uniref:Lipoprotein n=1 Tax=Pontimicrobium aquaticum TaxID=2565367 RepID=A0A4U0F0S0_9FLAO|nr:hypothetical protein [Pontimicrobium aquaticum]TJY38015.1 hypothetical protein E5167_01795 [Pontimicrobium aquaticum]